MKNERSSEHSRDEVTRERTYNVADVDLHEILDPNGQRMLRRQNRWNTKFNMNIEADLTLFDQQFKVRPDGELRKHQRASIESGDVRKAWTETFASTLSDIIDNAAQGREGTVFGEVPRITITAFRDDNRFVVEVQDTGDGIPQHILDALAQGIKSVSTKGEGREGGLGLTYAREAMYQLGGNMEIETTRKEDVKEGESTGTTIRFIFQTNAKEI